MERLHPLDLPSLELRRLHIDLIWCYEIMFGLVHINCEIFSFQQIIYWRLQAVTVTISSANRPNILIHVFLSLFGIVYLIVLTLDHSLPLKRTMLLVNFNQFLKVYKFSREQSDI